MKRPIIRSPQAEQDLWELANYMARNSISAALRFLEAAENSFERLAERPELGGICDSSNPRLAQLRILPIRGFNKHLIFYRPHNDRVEIVRVIYGTRDYERLFGS